MKVLITGGAGFIGRHVEAALLRAGHTPVIFDIAQKAYQDVRHPHAVRSYVQAHDAVIHLAAILGTQETIARPLPVAQTNLVGSLNVFEACALFERPCVYAAVGNKWMREYGTGAYTITKSAAEDFVEMYVKHRGATISVVRPVNAYGPWQSVPEPWGTSTVRKIMVTFIHQALSGQPIEVYGDGEQISDCVHVADVADNFVAAIGRTGTYGIGPATSHTVNEIANLVRCEVARQTGKPIVPIVHLPMRRGEVKGKTAVHNQVLVKPRVRLRHGIHDTVLWYREWYQP